MLKKTGKVDENYIQAQCKSVIIMLKVYLLHQVLRHVKDLSIQNSSCTLQLKPCGVVSTLHIAIYRKFAKAI